MHASLFTSIPQKPGIYALCAGQRQNKYIAYVGSAKKLRQRILQHLVRRDSSIVTGVAAVSLNPDKITEVRWWEFTPEESRYLNEAELIAFDVLNPTLRSRAKISIPSKHIAKERNFRFNMKKKISRSPDGEIKLLSYEEVISKILELEKIIKRK